MEPNQSEPKLTRRNFLKMSAGVMVLLTGGGLYRAIDQGVFATGDGPAYEPWHIEDETDLPDVDPLRFIRYALLAANAHNTQPWLFRVQPDAIQLFADLSRNIGTIDPYYREMTISLGCALENLCLAAMAHGYVPDVYLIGGNPDQIKVAEVKLSKGTKQPSDLFHVIKQRHTNRGAYDTDKKVPANLLKSMSVLGNDLPGVKLIWHTDELEKERIGSLIVEAAEAIIQDKPQSRDSYRWYRHDWDDIQRYKDGVTLDATGNSSLVRAFGKVFTVSESTSNDYFLKATKQVYVPTAAAFGSIIIRSRGVRELLMQTGRLWQRIHLLATHHGLAVQPLNQPNERQDRERQLGITPIIGKVLQEIAGDGEHVFTFRIGYAKEPALSSPRRSSDEVTLR